MTKEEKEEKKEKAREREEKERKTIMKNARDKPNRLKQALFFQKNQSYLICMSDNNSDPC